MVSTDLPFTNSYQTYKKLTATVATFLDETVVKIGLKPPRCQVVLGRSNPTKIRKESTHKLRVSDFVEYATLITTKPPPPVKVPDNIIFALEETLHLRKRVARFYDKISGDGKKTVSNETHSYFINILERVLEILKPKPTLNFKENSGGNSIGKGQQTPVDSHPLMNRFANLAFLEEKALEDTTAQNCTPLLNTDRDETELKATEAFARLLFDFEESMEEDMAAFCFFEDLNNIKDYVSDVWKKYANNKEDGTDIITAALVTNTAIELVRRLDEEFRRTMRQASLQGFVDIVSRALEASETERFVNSLLQKTAWTPLDLSSSNHDYWKDFETHPESEWLFLSTFLGIEMFMKFREIGRIPIPYIPFADKEDRGGPFLQSLLNPAFSEQMNISQAKLMEIMMIFNTYIDLRQTAVEAKTNDLFDMMWMDEIIHGIEERINSGITQTWLVFAVHICLDIHNVLGDKLSDPFQELRRAALAIKATMKLTVQMEDQRQLRQPETGPFGLVQSIIGLTDMFDEWILRDIIYDLNIENNPSVEQKCAYEEFFLMKNHPLMCGYLLFMITLVTRRVGMIMCAEWGTVIGPMHLYNALYKSGELKQEWPDMERLIELHGENVVFCGKRPSTKRECAERFDSICKTRPGFENSNISAVVEALGERYYNREGLKKELDVNKLEGLIRSLESGRFRRNKERISQDGISIVNLLQTLRDIIATEVPKLRVDYFSVHRRSLRMLFAIREEFRTDLNMISAIYDYNLEQATPFLFHDRKITTIVIFVLECTAAIERKTKKRFKIDAVRHYSEIYKLLFSRTAKVMLPIIQREGDVEIRKMDGY